MNQEKEEQQTEENPNEGLPPFVNTWKQLYGVVIAELVVLIGLFYWFTKAFE